MQSTRARQSRVYHRMTHTTMSTIITIDCNLNLKSVVFAAIERRVITSAVSHVTRVKVTLVHCLLQVSSLTRLFCLQLSFADPFKMMRTKTSTARTRDSVTSTLHPVNVANTAGELRGFVCAVIIEQ